MWTTSKSEPVKQSAAGGSGHAPFLDSTGPVESRIDVAIVKTVRMCKRVRAKAA
jgi:hypothetical protein